MFVKAQDSTFIELTLERYAKSVRRRLRRLVSGSPELVDVLTTFPALAFALASGFSTPDARGRAIQQIKRGEPLRLVASDLGLPLWLRALPPEAFCKPLADVPDGPDFGKRVGNLVPAEPALTAFWFDTLLQAHALCDTEFALWVAQRKELYLLNGFIRADVVSLLACHAWFSRSRCGEAARLIPKPWRKNQSLKTVGASAAGWSMEMLRACQRVPPKKGPGRYSLRNATRGFAIVLLRTPAELLDEGRAMDHCVGSYAADVLGGQCLIFGIRQNGDRVATMEVRGHAGARTMPKIVQLQGPGNSPVSRELAEMAQTWLLAHASDPVRGAHDDPLLAAIDHRRWERLWAPYMSAKSVTQGVDHTVQPGAFRHAAGTLSAVLR